MLHTRTISPLGICLLTVIFGAACTSEEPSEPVESPPQPETDAPVETDPPADTDEVVETDTDTPSCPTDSLLTWENFGSGFMSTWCTPCHGSQLEADARSGAPLSVNLDTLPDVWAHLTRIEATSVGEAARMPPAGGIPDSDLAALAEWVACGAPGTPRTPDPCATRRWEPASVTLTTQDDVDALCASANAIEGVLTIASDLTIDCLCEVTGGLEIEPGVTTVSLPGLIAMGVGLTVAEHESLEELSLPDLSASSGAVVLVDLPELETVDLPSLSVIGGNLLIERNPALKEMDLDALNEVRGSLRLTELGSLSEFELRYVSTIAGSLVIEDNPTLSSVDVFDALRHIQGQLLLSRNALLTAIDSFHALIDVGDELHISDNASLQQITGFHNVETVGKDIAIIDNASLVTVEAFTHLSSTLHGIQIARNEQLEQIRSFTYLEEVGLLGDWRQAGHQLRITDNPRLETIRGFEALRRVGGIVFEDNDSLPEVATEFSQLHVVMREISVNRNPALSSVGWLGTPNSVGTTLTITDNASLPERRALALVERIGPENIWGTITVSNNAP